MARKKKFFKYMPTQPKGVLPGKQFEVRSSLLTDLLEKDPNLKSLYMLIVAVFFLVYVNCIGSDLLLADDFSVGWYRMVEAFDKIEIALILWLCQHVILFLAYNLFVILFKSSIADLNSFGDISFYKYGMLPLFLIASYCGQIFIITDQLIKANLGMGSACFVSVEMLRLLMKWHSFCRTYTVKLSKFKQEDDLNKLPTFVSFMYFLFAPTLIFRDMDDYPRSGPCRPRYLVLWFTEAALIFFYCSFLFDHFVIPSYQNFGKEKLLWGQVIVLIFQNSLVGLALLFLIFYLVLHTWQNFFAEILTFGDRLFYKDWWTQNNFPAYFRTWNILVHDWLYMYIYKDLYENVFVKNKFAGKMAVFLISAVAHEYVLTLTLGFFFPALFVMFFFFGMLFSYVKPPMQWTFVNGLFLLGLGVGMGNLISLYAMEYFARLHCPVVEKLRFWDHLVPRILSCGCLPTIDYEGYLNSFREIFDTYFVAK